MNINYTFKNINERDKNFLENYLPKKIVRFKTLLKRYSEDSLRLEVKAEQFATKSAYGLEVILHLPGQNLRAREDDHTMIEATDLAVDKLIIQLRKFVGKNNK